MRLASASTRYDVSRVAATRVMSATSASGERGKLLTATTVAPAAAAAPRPAQNAPGRRLSAADLECLTRARRSAESESEQGYSPFEGQELTVGVLGPSALPSIRIQPATEFYDYQAKYFRDDTQYHCPSGLEPQAEAELAAAALATFRVTDCTGWGRVDFMREASTGKFYFIEINTTPGMTDHSLVPMAARQAGIDFDELVWRVLESSFVRQRK